MKVIGITGGVGSGKSVVMDILQKDYQAAILYSDLVAHELMQVGQKNYQEIISAFPSVLNEDQTINRQKLSEIVFHKKEELKKLDQITHPNIIEELKNRITKIKQENTHPFLALEAALLIEEEYDSLYDELWYIYAKEETRIERLQKGRGYTREKSISMIQNQRSEEAFEKKCQKKIDNSFDIEQTKIQISKALQNLIP